MLLITNANIEAVPSLLKTPLGVPVAFGTKHTLLAVFSGACTDRPWGPSPPLQIHPCFLTSEPSPASTSSLNSRSGSPMAS